MMRSWVVLVAALVAGCAAYTSIDVSPNDGDDSTYRQISAAGLISQLAGDENALYAVSINAGIWRRRAGGWWAHLQNSSVLTTSLAVDPLNPRHLISGDRNGDASQSDPSRFDLTQSGIWESFDAGDTWLWTFSPLT